MHCKEICLNSLPSKLERVPGVSSQIVPSEVGFEVYFETDIPNLKTLSLINAFAKASNVTIESLSSLRN